MEGIRRHSVSAAGESQLCLVSKFGTILLILCGISWGCSPSGAWLPYDWKPLKEHLQDVPEIPAEIVPFARGFSVINAMYVGPSGMVYVIDRRRNFLIRLASDGSRLDSLGGTGSGFSQFNQPFAVDATNDLKIYVADTGNRRVQLFDRRLQYLGTAVRTDRTGRAISYQPSYLAGMLNGELLLWDNDTFQMRKILYNGQFDETFALRGVRVPEYPRGIQVHNNLIHLLTSDGMILRFDEFGQYHSFIGIPHGAGSFTIHGKDFAILYEVGIYLTDARGESRGWIPLPLEGPRLSSHIIRHITAAPAGLLVAHSNAIFFVNIPERSP
jgi:hypothetical protein